MYKIFKSKKEISMIIDKIGSYLEFYSILKSMNIFKLELFTDDYFSNTSSSDFCDIIMCKLKNVVDLFIKHF